MKHGDKIYEHFGKLGTMGQTITRPIDQSKTGSKNISLVLQPAASPRGDSETKGKERVAVLCLRQT
jgi:hypothetical protein